MIEPESTLMMRTSLGDYHQYQGQSNDCGPTAAAILGNAYFDEDRFQGAEIAGQLNQIKLPGQLLQPLLPARIRGWATFPWGVTRFLRSHQIPAVWKLFGSREGLLHAVQVDRLTAVIVGRPLLWRGWRYAGWSHYLILVGYHQEFGWLLLDPAVKRKPEGTWWQQQGMIWKKDKEFFWLWGKMLRMIITVG
jgi:hypothetical protein